MDVLLNANFCCKLYALYAHLCGGWRLGGSEKGGSYKDRNGGEERDDAGSGWEGAERKRKEETLKARAAERHGRGVAFN